MPIFGILGRQFPVKFRMIDAVQAFLQSETVIIMQIFHQPTYFSGQKQVEIALINLEHIIFQF